MDAQHSQRIQALKQSFEVFNQVSERLEASYHHLESQVVHLADVLNQQTPAPKQVPAREDAAPYRAILMALPAGVVILDAKGRIAECNPSAIELLGEPLKGEVWTQVIQRAFAPRVDDGHEISLKNGRRVSISTCPIGEQPGQVLLLTDVTETRELQARVSQHQRLISMGEMAASLAHQLRTPLSTSLLFSSQLKNPELESSQRQQTAQKLISHLRHLESLISDMLLFSRQGYGGDECIPVKAFIEQLADAIGPMCEQTGVTFNLHIEVENARIKGNANVLHSALMNLVNNAIQAMSGNGDNAGCLQIIVRESVCDSVDICVIDNGPGVSAAVQEKLFQPFFTTRRNGTGLGLAVVNAVARAHGGSIRVNSEEGAGSEFIMRIPLAAESHVEEESLQSADLN